MQNQNNTAMTGKKILGLDLGTNSIGWSLINLDFEQKEGNIDGLGSRIIPMTQDVLDKFGSGASISQTADRTTYRGIRRLRQRNLLRRERLHRVLNILNFLPEHYAQTIDFNKHLGQFQNGKETKLNYRLNNENKHEFIFMEAYAEMLQDFKEKQPQLLQKKINGEPAKIPYDWTIYYLRKKALTEKISKQELAWIILNFNQKRGYYQLRGEEEEIDETKNEAFYSLKVEDVQATEDSNAKGVWYNVVLENGWIYRRQSKESLDNWIGKNKEFIVTTQIENDGSPKLDQDSAIKRSFRAVDSEKDWIAIKKKTEQDIEQTEKTVGQYIYDTLLKNPSQKIRGKLVKTIERKFYKEELEAIFRKQLNEHPELKDRKLYQACVEELYPRNEAHQSNIRDKDFAYLFIYDIIFHQRPLRSQRSTISGCAYEVRTFRKIIKTKDPYGNEIEKEVTVKEPIKVISKSHPLYQEFRLWQFLKNLRIYQKEKEEGGKIKIDVDITDELLLDDTERVELFDFLNVRKEVEQKNIIQFFLSKKKIEKAHKDNYRWNYVEDKKYPCNETHAQFLSRLSLIPGMDAKAFLTPEREKSLWHIVYSVTDKKEFEKALAKYAGKNGLNETDFVENFKKMPPYSSDYGAYSEKAIKKLLPVIRIGKYWDENSIQKEVKERISAIIERLTVINYEKERIDDSVADDDIPAKLLKSFIPFKDRNPLKGLNTYQACYAVYDRHAEVSDVLNWRSPQDIDKYLEEFKQHSLRNPIVEQVVTETLRVVRDIWDHYGEGKGDFFDEIHVELGRDMKNPAKKREDLSRKVTENQNTNQRIKELLEELKSDTSIEGDIRPYSPSHQEILKIYEEGVRQNPAARYDKASEDEIAKIQRNSSPSRAEILKYKLWLEQGYISPYTGQAIPLSRLFTTEYQVEHIIPQSRYFDDSMSNKVICESAVNELKDRSTAYEFIKNNQAAIVDLGMGNQVKVFTLENYEKHCNEYFKSNRVKLKNLMSEEVPESFINRQMNDSRYISKLVKGLLSNVVRNENEQEATSKNLLPVAGSITAKLKQDWGLNDKWNELISYRFKRLNELTNSEEYGFWDSTINAFRCKVPDEIAKGFDKKRIDHRHHALDALVVACTTRRHVHYLNALNAEKENYSLKDILLTKNKHGHHTKNFQLPWSGFVPEAKTALETTVVSFKQNLRVINKASNKTWQWVKKNGQLKKVLVDQTKGDNWAMRKPLHKETVYGRVNIKRNRNSPVSFNSALENIDLIVDQDIKGRIKEKSKFYKNDLKLIKKYFKDNPLKINGKTED